MENDIKMSQFCKGKAHSRIEDCQDLIGDKKYRTIGTCKVCGGTRKYEHLDLAQFGSINIPSERRDFLLFRDKPERVTHMNRHLVGGA
jgi:hypothetical protein